jgi:hypothetical protein
VIAVVPRKCNWVAGVTLQSSSLEDSRFVIYIGRLRLQRTAELMAGSGFEIGWFLMMVSSSVGSRSYMVAECGLAAGLANAM